MAKAKKTTAGSDAAPASQKAAAPCSSNKKAAAPAAAATGVPMIDTANAAVNAAKLLAGRAKQAEPKVQETKESGNFKQLKQSLNRPTASQSATLLGNSLGATKSGLPFHQQGSKQVAHNQTFGVARVNVPRRTNG